MFKVQEEAAPISLSGGTITAGVAPGDGYTYFAFISSGDLTVTGGSGMLLTSWLLVAVVHWCW